MSKILVDMDAVTPNQLAQAGELLGCSITDAMAGPKAPLVTPAIASVQNPGLTYEDACNTPVADFDVKAETADASPKAPGEPNGLAPPALLATGL